MRAALWAVVAGAAGVFILMQRKDAKDDLRAEIKQEDQDNADEIENRVSHDRADSERLHEYSDTGYRD